MSHEEPPHGPQRNSGLGTDRVHRKEVAAAGPVLTTVKDASGFVPCSRACWPS